MPASSPHSAACSRPKYRERRPRGDADDNARENLHHEKAADLRRDAVDDLDRQFLLRQRRARQLDELPPEHLVREQDEVGEKQDHDQLVQRGDRAHRSRPQEARRRHTRLFDLHAHDAGRGFGRVGFLQALRRPARLSRAARAAGAAGDRSAPMMRRAPVGSSLMTVIASSCSAYAPPPIVAKVNPSAIAAADPSRHTDPLHRIDSRIERVKQQQAERQRREQRLHVLQQENRDAERDHDQRRRAGVEPCRRRLGRFGDRCRQAWYSAIYAAKSYRSRSRRSEDSNRRTLELRLHSCRSHGRLRPTAHSCFPHRRRRCACRDAFAAACLAAGAPASISIRGCAGRSACDRCGQRSGRCCSRGGSGRIAAIIALIYDNWGWAIGTGLMAVFAFLVVAARGAAARRPRS